MEVNVGSMVTKSAEPIAVEVDGELVMLDIESGNYLGLSPVGTRIWELLDRPRSVGDVVGILGAEYDVPPEVCTRETLDFIGQLLDNGLVRVD